VDTGSNKMCLAAIKDDRLTAFLTGSSYL